MVGATPSPRAAVPPRQRQDTPWRGGTMRDAPVEQEVQVERRSGPYDRRDPDPPHEALESLVRLIEYELPQMRGSILLLDPDGVTLRHGAAPSLPPQYC